MSKTVRFQSGHLLTGFLPGVALFAAFLSLAGNPRVLRAQDAASAGAEKAQYAKVLGSVVSISPDGKSMTVKSDAGATAEVQLDSNTSYMSVPPGEKDLRKATRIALSDIGPGDRVYARSRKVEGQAQTPANSVFVMSKSDLAKHQEKTRDEWQTRGAAGKVTAIDPAAKTITITTSRMGASKQIVIQTDDKTGFRRYAPDSVKFSDAVPSKMSEIEIGNNVRVLGDKDAEGNTIHGEEIVSGSFRTLAGTVASVDPASEQIKLNDLQTKQQITVKVNGDTNLRKLPAPMAALLARAVGGTPGMPAGGHVQGGPDSKPGFNGPGASSGGAAAGGAAPAGAAAGGAAAGGAAGSGAPGAPGGAAGSGRGDLNRMLERMPLIQLADLKPGDALIINSTNGTDPSRVTAITVVAGVEPLIAAAATSVRGLSGQSAISGSWNLGGDVGLPQ